MTEIINKPEDSKEEIDTSISEEQTESTDEGLGLETNVNAETDSSAEEQAGLDVQDEFINSDDYKTLTSGLDSKSKFLVDDTCKRLQSIHTKAMQKMPKKYRDSELLKGLETKADAFDAMQKDENLANILKRYKDGTLNLSEVKQETKAEIQPTTEESVDAKMSIDDLLEILPDANEEDKESLERFMPVFNAMIKATTDSRFKNVETKTDTVFSKQQKLDNANLDKDIQKDYGDTFEDASAFQKETDAVHLKYPSLSREEAFILASNGSLRKSFNTLSAEDVKKTDIIKAKPDLHISKKKATGVKTKALADMTKEEVLEYAKQNNLVEDRFAQ